LRVTEKKNIYIYIYRTEIYFWRRSAMTFRLPKVRHKIKRENASNTNKFGKTGKQNVEMVWTRSTHGG